MGLNEYIAYRVAARGQEDDAAGLFLGLFMLGMAVFAAIGFVITSAGEFVYTTVRPVLMIAPEVSVVLGGFLLGSVLFALPAYTDETAARMVRGDDGDDDTTGFYVRHFSVLMVMTVSLFVVLVVQADANFSETFLTQYISHPAVWITAGIFYLIGFPYTIYQFFHLPYRYHRLLRRAPYGTLYSLVTVFPLTGMLVIGFFNIPITITEAPLWSPVGLALTGCLIAIPYGVPLVFVKFQAESYIPRLDATSPSAGSATSGD